MAGVIMGRVLDKVLPWPNEEVPETKGRIVT